MSRILSQDAQAQWALRGDETRYDPGRDGPRQQRRVWCVAALKPKITESMFEAGVRAVRECSPALSGGVHDMGFVDKHWSDLPHARIIDAERTRANLHQAVRMRADTERPGLVLEGVLQLHTLTKVAEELGYWRGMGQRPDIPDKRCAEAPVMGVLKAMAEFYEECAVSYRQHKAAAR